MVRVLEAMRTERGEPIAVRVGINSGPVVAGVIGSKKFLFDLWGDTVKVASRMQSSGEPGRIKTTEEFFKLLSREFDFCKREAMAIKGKGELTYYFLDGPKGFASRGCGMTT